MVYLWGWEESKERGGGIEKRKKEGRREEREEREGKREERGGGKRGEREGERYYICVFIWLGENEIVIIF